MDSQRAVKLALPVHSVKHTVSRGNHQLATHTEQAVCVCVCVCVCVVCVCMCMCVCVLCVYVYVYVCVRERYKSLLASANDKSNCETSALCYLR